MRVRKDDTGQTTQSDVVSSASSARSSVLLALAPCLNHVRRSSSVLPAAYTLILRPPLVVTVQRSPLSLFSCAVIFLR